MAMLDLDPHSAAELNRLLDEALDRPPAEREQWLRSLPQSAVRLEPLLRDLLSRSGGVETGDFLHTLPKLEGVAAQHGGNELHAGMSVGPYSLVRELGQGGMGSVWLAERTDGLVNRAVALKLPNGSWQQAGFAERMAREREILATLEHPNIARLYDAGLTTSNQPYLALEYVEGLALDRYTSGTPDRPPPDLQTRLRLFLQVLEAIAYAHGKLVLHRDLKPANILVTHAGHVRLLDFGIAKLLDDGRADETRLTELTGRALTIEYASPEQIRGEPLAVTSDVYSLGVILYELLTGKRPYKLKRDSRGALEDAIIAAEPARPSDAAPSALRARLRGDLDTIVLKALKKLPQERYPTANAFADDIVRHLEQRPVLARPDRAWYRSRQFVRRHALAVSAACLVVIAILVGAGVAVSEANKARIEQRRAEAIKDYIVAMFEHADPQSTGGKPLTAAELVSEAAQQVMSGDMDDPLARAEITRMLARTLVQLRDKGNAEQVATRAVAEARRLFPPDHIEVLRARLLLADALRFRNALDEMRTELVEVRRVLAPQQHEYPRDYLSSQSALTALEIEAVRYEAAVASAREGVSVAKRYFGANSIEYGRALRGLSEALGFARQAPEAARTARESFDAVLAVHGGNHAHPDVVVSRVILSSALAATGDARGAVEHIEAAIADSIASWGPNNTRVGYYHQRSVNYYLKIGQGQKALAAARRAFEILSPEMPPDSMTYASAQNAIGKSLIAVARGAEAEPVMQIVAESAARLFGAQHRNTLEARAMYAFTVAETGDIRRATQLIEACIAERDAASVKTTVPTMVAGQIARRAGNATLAVELLQRSLEPESTLQEPAQRGAVQVELGLAELALRRSDPAEVSLRAGLEQLQQSGHDSTPAVADAYDGLSRIEAARGQWSAALSHATRAHEFWQAFDAAHPQATAAAQWLAEVRGRTTS
jgi:serine/threonine-protein kinase